MGGKRRKDNRKPDRIKHDKHTNSLIMLMNLWIRYNILDRSLWETAFIIHQEEVTESIFDFPISQLGFDLPLATRINAGRGIFLLISIRDFDPAYDFWTTLLSADISWSWATKERHNAIGHFEF